MRWKSSCYNKTWIALLFISVQTVYLGQSTNTDNIGNDVSFPHGKSAYIVASSKSALAKKIVDRLSSYISTVTHKTGSCSNRHRKSFF